MKKREVSSDNRMVPSIRRNEISRSSLKSYKRSKSSKNRNISEINLLPLIFGYFEDENIEEKIKREQEILQSPLVRSIKISKLLFDESLTVDDHYSDSLAW